MATQRVIVSRDIKFLESSFPHKDPNKLSNFESQVPSSVPTSHPPLVTFDEDIDPSMFPSVPANEDQETPLTVEETMDPSVRPTAPTTQLRRSIRERRPSSTLKGFDTSLPTSLTITEPAPPSASPQVYPLANHVSYDRFSVSHKAFLSAITLTKEPKSYREAAIDPRWQKAMKQEIEALEANQTWELTTLPPGKKAIDSKWVYKVKFKPSGDIERFKARLVAKGFTQIPGVDYHDTFAPVAKMVTVRSLIAVAALRNWPLHQLDVNNAFLHGDLDEEVYMKMPEGFGQPNDTRVCRLKRSLYGLKQASRNWHAKFTSSLLQLGFKQSKFDYSLFIAHKGSTFVAALIYVDDVVLTGNNEQFISLVKQRLDNDFSIKDLGPLKFFLGIEVARSPNGIVLSQRKYAIDILEDSGLANGRPSAFPMEQHHQLGMANTPSSADPGQYRRLIGRLLYLTVTRPDLQYSVNFLCQFVADPKQEHFTAAARVLRYLKQSPGQGLFFPSHGSLQLEGFCDADWGGCALTRRSTTGYFIRLGAAPISWRTKKQSVVARSSAEAEYRSMATAVSELIWLRGLLVELGVPQTQSTPLHCDNQAALHIAANPVFHERTKHVEMDCHFVRERVQSGEILPIKINTRDQLADLFTKALGAERFRYLLRKLGICDLHASV
ncbi:unnamed protein product [Linum trigynum]|uniref:Reverse transcriptase Ty1/copia-type domain-containing protein n=1 Tax=Linum trigynum TaxID=586398 RepID=A0AAV2F295_9ROSI